MPLSAEINQPACLSFCRKAQLPSAVTPFRGTPFLLPLHHPGALPSRKLESDVILLELTVGEHRKLENQFCRTQTVRYN